LDFYRYFLQHERVREERGERREEREKREERRERERRERERRREREEEREGGEGRREGDERRGEERKVKTIITTNMFSLPLFLPQYPILSVTINQLNYNFYYAESLFGIFAIVCFAFPIYLVSVDKRKMKEMHSVNSINSSAGSDTESVTSEGP
jgi:hypothetical protein